jgi:hypothetical protein
LPQAAYPARMTSTFSWDVLLGHRLLRKPGGFEGLRGIDKHLEAYDAAVLEGGDEPDGGIELNSTRVAPRVDRAEHDHLVIEVSNLADLGSKLSPWSRSSLEANHLSHLAPEAGRLRCRDHFRVGSNKGHETIDVPSVPCLDSTADDFHVLLRHGPRSISRHARGGYERGPCRWKRRLGCKRRSREGHHPENPRRPLGSVLVSVDGTLGSTVGTTHEMTVKPIRYRARLTVTPRGRAEAPPADRTVPKADAAG